MSDQGSHESTWINRTSSFAQGSHWSTRSLGKAFLKRWFHLPFNLQAVSFNLLFFRPVLAYQGSTKDNGGTFTASNQAIANTRSHIYCTVFAVSLMARRSSQILWFWRCGCVFLFSLDLSAGSVKDPSARILAYAHRLCPPAFLTSKPLCSSIQFQHCVAWARGRLKGKELDTQSKLAHSLAVVL